MPADVTVVEAPAADATHKPLYECTNDGCVLGSRTDPGYFTDGVTESEAVARFGDGADYGSDICPMCGKKGKATGDTFEPNLGEDPHQEVHNLVADAVKKEVISADEANDVAHKAIAIITDEDNSISKPQTAVDHAITNN